MTRDEVIEILEAERHRVYKVMRLVSELEQLKKEKDIKATIYDSPKVQGGNYNNHLDELIDRKDILEKEIIKLSEPLEEFSKIIKCLDDLESMIIIEYYSNRKSYKEIIKNYIKNNKNVPHPNWIWYTKDKAIEKMTKYSDTL